MGLAAVAGHVVILVALATASTLLVAALSDNFTDVISAQSQAIHRLRSARAEDVDLRDDHYEPGPDRVLANWTNNGSEEIPLDDVTVLVDGDHHPTGDLETFELRNHPSSDVWAPKEILEITDTGEGNADLTVVAPHGTAAFRRS